MMTMEQVIGSNNQQLADNTISFGIFSPKPKLHVIVPCYNESQSILKIIERIQHTLVNNYDYRLTIIDDGSTDNSVELLNNSCSLNFNLHINSLNMGKNSTLLKGFNFTDNNEIVIMLDGDGEHLPEEIPRLIQPIINKQADMVIGTRFRKSADLNFACGSYLKNGKQFSFLRKLGNNIISFLILLIYQTKISDSQSGFRVFAPGEIQKFHPKFNGFTVETEIVLNFINRRKIILEIPIDTGLSARESHMNIFEDSLKIFIVIVDMKFPRFSKILQKSLQKYLKNL